MDERRTPNKYESGARSSEVLTSHSAYKKPIWKPVLFLLTKPLKQIRGCGCLNATFKNNLVIPSFTRLIVMTVLASVCFLTISSDENCLTKFALTGLFKSYHEWWFESLCTFLCITLFLFESLGTL